MISYRFKIALWQRTSRMNVFEQQIYHGVKWWILYICDWNVFQKWWYCQFYAGTSYGRLAHHIYSPVITSSVDTSSLQSLKEGWNSWRSEGFYSSQNRCNIRKKDEANIPELQEWRFWWGQELGWYNLLKQVMTIKKKKWNIVLSLGKIKFLIGSFFQTREIILSCHTHTHTHTHTHIYIYRERFAFVRNKAEYIRTIW